eukprot:6674859-Prymnesium_polylepis.1
MPTFGAFGSDTCGCTYFGSRAFFTLQIMSFSLSLTSRPLALGHRRDWRGVHHQSRGRRVAPIA